MANSVCRYYVSLFAIFMVLTIYCISYSKQYATDICVPPQPAAPAATPATTNLL